MTSKPLSFEDLFDADFLSRLHAFRIGAARVVASGRPAEHVSRARGAGIEFADYKPYAPGDDLRAIDWNIYRRLGRLFVRVFDEQRDLPVHLLVDTSKSMFFEDPPRIRGALRVAAALSSISLGQHDSVSLYSCSDDLQTKVRSLSGSRMLTTMAHAMADLEEDGGTDLAEAVARLNGMGLRRGLLVILSDFFDPAGPEPLFRALKEIRHRILLVQMTREADADPRGQVGGHGEMRLVDSEEGGSVDVVLTPQLIERYQDAYRAFTDRLAALADERGAGLVRIDADRDVLEQLSAIFPSGVLTV